jgi:copper chaperone CopZ
MEDHCQVSPIQKISSAEENANTMQAYLAISGLNCPNCANRVRNALISSLGVTDALVDHIDGLAEVTYNPDLIRPTHFMEIVSKAGGDGIHRYSAEVIG